MSKFIPHQEAVVFLADLIKVDSVKCRACHNYEHMAEPDGLSDNLFTCWCCKTHPFRRKLGVLTVDVDRWEKIYNS